MNFLIVFYIFLFSFYLFIFFLLLTVFSDYWHFSILFCFLLYFFPLPFSPLKFFFVFASAMSIYENLSVYSLASTMIFFHENNITSYLYSVLEFFYYSNGLIETNSVGLKDNDFLSEPWFFILLTSMILVMTLLFATMFFVRRKQLSAKKSSFFGK